MELTRKLDEHGKGAWIGVMILSFILFWPVGLAILGYLIWSGRMQCWKLGNLGGRGRWHNARSKGHHHKDSYEASSCNSAFDAYRDETLKRLEDEQSEFEGFLEQLRHAKDKAEFDQFMDDRRAAPNEPPKADGEPEQPHA
ncbi:MAG: DUF2852 domain-containing protein [Alphaproteobacteria bacterium]|nr:DUF2852 domain-containing protein [Alphaproteobacteria bacterium]